ncbi:hypothetical protein LUZ60_000026 [Juncus effusus]|nr:hypothetical protein LUZ60_000026 [Juncus effusus]
MSSAVGAVSRSKDVGSEEKSEKNRVLSEKGEMERLNGQMSEASIVDASEEEDEDEEEDQVGKPYLGPRVSIKDQLEKDKDDESLRRWKEQLLGTVDLNSVGAEKLEPEVTILSLSIVSPGRADIVLPLPVELNSKGVWFTLKEGSPYKLKFSFAVTNNIVSGLRYTNTVWKTGIKVDKAKEMLGTFSPQLEPYTYQTPEETTPSGMFARGTYAARTKFIDDDHKCYLEINYNFDIRRDWAA